MSILCFETKLIQINCMYFELWCMVGGKVEQLHVHSTVDDDIVVQAWPAIC